MFARGGTKFPKRFGYSKNHRTEVSLLDRALLYIVGRFMDPELRFSSSDMLIRPHRVPKYVKAPDEWPWEDPEFMLARAFETKAGEISRGVAVRIASSVGCWLIGKVLFFPGH